MRNRKQETGRKRAGARWALRVNSAKYRVDGYPDRFHSTATLLCVNRRVRPRNGPSSRLGRDWFAIVRFIHQDRGHHSRSASRARRNLRCLIAMQIY
jgi:hypothetical protein